MPRPAGSPSTTHAPRRVPAGEVREGRVPLVDGALLAVGAGAGVAAARRDQFDVGALPPEDRLAGVGGQVARPVEVGREEIGVAGEELPEDRQDRLVGEDRLPGRLDPAGQAEAVERARAEAIGDQPLPRVELEDREQRLAVRGDEAAAREVPADLLHGEGRGGEPGLPRGFPQVGDGQQVLAAGLLGGVGEVDAAVGEARAVAPPGRDEALVERVPLVAAGVRVLQPVPLDHRRFEEGGGGVGVVFEQLRRAVAAVAQVEAPVERRRVPLPGLLDRPPGERGDAEIAVAAAGDDVLDRFEAAGVQLPDRPLQPEDLVQGERVVDRLVPEGADRAVRQDGVVVHQPLVPHDPLVAGAGGGRVAAHQPPVPRERPLSPNPPLSTPLGRV